MASDDFRGMGTTVSALVILPQGALVAHVGDSRIYRLRGSRLEQLTFDHSLVWELQAAGQIPAEDVPNYIPKNIITRSLGPNPEAQVDLEGFFPVEPGDTFLLCSDGLSGQVPDDEIGQVLAACRRRKRSARWWTWPTSAAGRTTSRDRGPRDRAAGRPRSRRREPPSDAAPAQPRRPRGFLAVAGLLALAAAVLAAAGQRIAAAVSLLGAAGAAGVALWQRRWHRRPPGQGPTAWAKAPIGPAMPAAERVRLPPGRPGQGTPRGHRGDRLDDRLGRRSMPMSPGPRHAAEAAHYGEAVAEYCRAVSFMMAQLRSQQEHKRPGDN